MMTLNKSVSCHFHQRYRAHRSLHSNYFIHEFVVGVVVAFEMAAPHLLIMVIKMWKKMATKKNNKICITPWKGSVWKKKDERKNDKNDKRNSHYRSFVPSRLYNFVAFCFNAHHWAHWDAFTFFTLWI